MEECDYAVRKNNCFLLNTENEKWIESLREKIESLPSFKEFQISFSSHINNLQTLFDLNLFSHLHSEYVSLTITVRANILSLPLSENVYSGEDPIILPSVHDLFILIALFRAFSKGDDYSPTLLLL